MTLIDSSVWIASFAKRPTIRVVSLVKKEEILTCLPVIQEVLQGIRDGSTFRRVREAMFAVPIVESPLTAAVVREAVDLYRLARRHGYTIRSSMDCLIAACAIRHDAEVMHRDRDYVALARISSLRERSV